MAKIKLTKNELKKQKDALKRFERYLPTLVLKKQQLQMEIRKVEAQIEARIKARETLENRIMEWISVLGEDAGLPDLIRIKEIKTDLGNIAGIDIPLFLGIDFEEIGYDLFALPLWVDTAIENIREALALAVEIEILEEQIRLIKEELRITSQRVNLFEKVKIPETRENIRVIQIYLGDQQVAAVVRGKISKKKLVKVS